MSLQRDLQREEWGTAATSVLGHPVSPSTLFRIQHGPRTPNTSGIPVDRQGWLAREDPDAPHHGAWTGAVAQLPLPGSLQCRGLQHARLPCPSLSPRSLLKLMSIESVMPSNLLVLCRPLLLLPSIFPSIRVFSNESALHRWPKY